MSKANLINLIIQYLKGLSGNNYQNAVKQILSTYYKVINKNMHIYFAVEKSETDDFNYNTMAELLGNGTTPSDVAKICRTCKLIDDFLEYIKKDGEYQIAEEYDIYWSLEALGVFLNKNPSLSALEMLNYKYLFFDYMLTLNVTLKTQTLRDNLIKYIFKDQKATQELYNEHLQIIGNDIRGIIDQKLDTDTFNAKIKNLKESEKSEEDYDAYNRILQRFLIKNQIELPLKNAKSALKSIESIDITPFLNSSSETALNKLDQINGVLKEIKELVDTLISTIDEHE